jgi:hypothetical protein
MKQMTDKFLVITDSGKEYIIHEYTDIIYVNTFENPKATIPGLKEFRTSDGMAVNFVEEGIYMIVPFGVIARKIST